MLSKQKRATSADIAVLFKKALPVGMPFFVARRSAVPADEKSRFAIIAPKTIAKKAVLRNSLRRKWSAALRAALQINHPSPALFAFTLKKEAIDISLPERVSAFVSYFKKVQ